MESCGSLNLSLEPLNKPGKKNREIQAKMLFGDTEIKATATDIALSQSVKVYVDFMNESNPKYVTKLWKKFFYILLFITITIPISILYLAKFWNTISLKNVSEIFDAPGKTTFVGRKQWGVTPKENKF